VLAAFSVNIFTLNMNIDLIFINILDRKKKFSTITAELINKVLE